MVVSPVLVIKIVDDSSVGVRARWRDDFVEHHIVLNSVLAYWWANELPPGVKFLELLESVIKRTINELTPHKTLKLKSNQVSSLFKKISCGFNLEISKSLSSLFIFYSSVLKIFIFRVHRLQNTIIIPPIIFNADYSF